MKRLIMVMGPPGSGKSTYVRHHKQEEDAHFEADMFFMEDGEYKFNRERLKEAHEWCQEKTERAMINGVENIYVSNTFIKAWERKTYLDLARNYGYIVHFVRMNTMYNNIHNVPDSVVINMVANIQEVSEKELYGLPGIVFEEVK